MHAHTYTHQIHTHAYPHIHKLKHMYTQTHTCIHICTHAYTPHTHTHTHTHAHTPTHTYTNTLHTPKYTNVCKKVPYTCIIVINVSRNVSHFSFHLLNQKVESFTLKKIIKYMYLFLYRSHALDPALQLCTALRYYAQGGLFTSRGRHSWNK